MASKDVFFLVTYPKRNLTPEGNLDITMRITCTKNSKRTIAIPGLQTTLFIEEVIEGTPQITNCAGICQFDFVLLAGKDEYKIEIKANNASNEGYRKFPIPGPPNIAAINSEPTIQPSSGQTAKSSEKTATDISPTTASTSWQPPPQNNTGGKYKIPPSDSATKSTIWREKLLDPDNGRNLPRWIWVIALVSFLSGMTMVIYPYRAEIFRNIISAIFLAKNGAEKSPQQVLRPESTPAKTSINKSSELKPDVSDSTITGLPATSNASQSSRKWSAEPQPGSPYDTGLSVNSGGAFRVTTNQDFYLVQGNGKGGRTYLVRVAGPVENGHMSYRVGGGIWVQAIASGTKISIETI